MNTIQISTMFVELSEYNRLKQENTELHNRINQLTHESSMLNVCILEKNLEIDMLRKENQELREKIKILENKIENQQKEIDDLKKENDDRKNNELFKKIMIGIQDLNALELLEKSISNDELRNLRNDRVGDCHYINSNYSQQEKDIRINILIDRIKKIPQVVSNKFEDLYPNLLNDLEPFLKKRDVNFNQKFVNRANDWWN